MFSADPPPDARRDPGVRQLADLQKALEKELDKQPVAKDAEADATDSMAGRFFSKVWSEPKYRYATGAVIVGEMVLATMLWRSMAKNVATFNNQIAAVQDVRNSMRDATRSYVQAERNLMRALAGAEGADRAALSEAAKGLDPRAQASFNRALAPPKGGAAPATPPPTIEAATRDYQRAYAAWQEQAATEARVLRAAGRPAATPAPLTETLAGAEARTKALTRLNFSSGEFAKFKNEMGHLNQTARAGLGQGLTWRGRFWRRARTGLLLLAIPVIAVGITMYYDREVEANRRLEALNDASRQDRTNWINTLVPYFHRPMLFAVVRAWNRVSQQPNSDLRRFRCPYELKPVEEDNPHLQTIQAFSLQTLIEMQENNIEVLEENNMRTVKIGPEFYRRLFRNIIRTESPALSALEERDLTKLVNDLASEAYRAFDQYEEPVIVAPGGDQNGAIPPLGAPKGR